MKKKIFNQKQICLKLDEDNIDLLEREIFASGINRNRLINIAIRQWIRMLDINRSLACTTGDGKDFLNSKFNTMGLHHIAERFS